MLVVFSDSHDLYTDLRKSYHFIEYSHNNIEVCNRLSIPTPLPLKIALKEKTNAYTQKKQTSQAQSNIISNNREILLLCPDSPRTSEVFIALGIIKSYFPYAGLCYICYDTGNDITHTSIASSISTVHIQESELDTSPRPIYFDHIVRFSEELSSIPTYSDAFIYEFFFQASKYFKSHSLHLMCIPNHTSLIDAIQSQVLFDSFHACAELVDSERLSPEMLRWILDMKKLCSLTSTETHQLQNLVLGYIQQHNTDLSEDLKELVHTQVSNIEDKKAIFHRCKKLIEDTLR